MIHRHDPLALDVDIDFAAPLAGGLTSANEEITPPKYRQLLGGLL